MQSKKPPDKYRTIKCSLKSIIKSNLDLNKLSDAMIRTHKLIIHSYQFIRLWILSKYNKKLDILYPSKKELNILNPTQKIYQKY
mgnify:CR=1 FL=1